GSPRALRPMISLAKRAGRTEVRNRAIDVLGALGHRQAEETLVRILGNRAEAESTRCCAAVAIGGMQRPGDGAIRCLVEALKEHSAILRWTILTELGVLGERRTIPDIQACLQDDEIVPQFPAKTTVASAAKNALKNLKVCSS